MKGRSECIGWLTAEVGVSRETIQKLDAYVELLLAANQSQNLIGAHSIDDIWKRHILDCAQLAPRVAGKPLDLGSGAGLPGLVLAILLSGPITLVDSRALRVAFLRDVCRRLDLSNCDVRHGNARTLPAERFDTIVARAFAPLDLLLEIGSRFASTETTWVLPKGKGAHVELEAARRTWQGDFQLRPSITDADAQIIVATGVRKRREPRKR